jgi:hypothetical protein
MKHKMSLSSGYNDILAARGSWSMSKCVSLYYNAFNEGVISFYSFRGRKKRKIYRSGGPFHQALDIWIASELLKHVSYPNRFKQSKADLMLLKSDWYNYLVIMDLVDALNKNNVFMMLFVNFFFTPILVLKIALATLVLFRSSHMLVGMRTSQLLLALCFENVRKLHIGEIDTQIYVDDFRMASKSKFIAYLNIYIYKVFFGMMRFRWHKHSKFKFINLKVKQKYMFERLGLEFGYRRNGEVYSRIRHSTIKKYQQRAIAILTDDLLSTEEKLIRLDYLIYKGRFSLERAFPSYLRLGDAQSIQFQSWLRKKKYYYLVVTPLRHENKA